MPKLIRAVLHLYYNFFLSLASMKGKMYVTLLRCQHLIIGSH
jgi:hypothetical protein